MTVEGKNGLPEDGERYDWTGSGQPRRSPSSGRPFFLADPGIWVKQSEFCLPREEKRNERVSLVFSGQSICVMLSTSRFSLSDPAIWVRQGENCLPR